jgi:superfamily II DNA or RNA helicase
LDWADWLGTEYWPFEKARDYVHKLGLKNVEDWYDWCKSGNRPRYMPSSPDDRYRDEGWVDWYDWLGTEETIWSVKRVKQLLRDLIKDNLIYEADEIILYNILYTKGLLNLRNRDRHGRFFKNLLKAVKTSEGCELIEKYVNSDSETPPDLSGSATSPDEELATATYRDIEESEQLDPLDSGPIKSVEQIFKEAHRLESYVEDIESMQFHVSHYVQQLWQNAFLNEEEAVSKIKLNGNKYHDAISETFLLEHGGARSVNVPPGYEFPKGSPNLMQLLVAYKVKTNRRFGNFSKTGTGKTLSAVLASRVVDSHMTVIICPNAVVKQWGEDIEQIFPDSVVKLGKAAFYEKRDENKHKYLVINYDLFSQPHSANWILELTKQKIDFIILDEIHFTKKRENIEESKRHEKIRGLMTHVAENKNVYVLGMSATPVINELQEGISLLELITGKIYDDLSNRATTQNAVKLHEKLALNSIRKIPDEIDYDVNIIEVKQDVTKVNVDVAELKRNPLKVEQLGLDAKIPEIISHIQGKTIIYTEYVDTIVDKIKTAVEEAGYKCAKFTGKDHSGLARFKEDEKLQVLVASRPVSTGVDGLQDVCHNLIISCLPWTSAGFDQLTGRIIRQGQNSAVNIHFIKAKLFAEGRGELQYDEKKWKMILYKRSIADCAVDGKVPEKNMLDKKQVQMEAIRWYERITRGEISIIERRS